MEHTTPLAPRAPSPTLKYSPGALRSLWSDDRGFIISAELVMISTVVVLGLIAGLSCVRDAVTGELTDVADAIGSLNQSYYYTGFHGCWDPCCGIHSFTTGSCFDDEEDHGDEDELCFDGRHDSHHRDRDDDRHDHDDDDCHGDDCDDDDCEGCDDDDCEDCHDHDCTDCPEYDGPCHDCLDDDCPDDDCYDDDCPDDADCPHEAAVIIEVAPIVEPAPVIEQPAVEQPVFEAPQPATPPPAVLEEQPAVTVEPAPQVEETIVIPCDPSASDAYYYDAGTIYVDPYCPYGVPPAQIWRGGAPSAIW